MYRKNQNTLRTTTITVHIFFIYEIKLFYSIQIFKKLIQGSSNIVLIVVKKSTIIVYKGFKLICVIKLVKNKYYYNSQSSYMQSYIINN